MNDVAEKPKTRGSGRPSEYKLADGTRVRGVTTILGRFKESGGLLQWAFQQGKSGLSSLYEKRDEAADIGSLVHGWVEADIHGIDRPDVPPDQLERVKSAFGAWREWFEGGRMQIVATEVPLVSELYRYGGTIDAVARDGKGRLCLLDWKSSNAVYADYAIQLAAYRQLWNERAIKDGTDAISEGGYHLCRFAKEHGDFEHRYWPDLSEAWSLFALYLQAYELDKALSKRIK
jgi:hypothetical protein